MKKSLSLVILIILFLTACGTQTQSLSGNYAGQVDGSNAFIGLVTNGESIMAFFCDGTSDVPPELWGWFRGELNDNSFDLTSENGDHLTGEFNENNASGTITLTDGTALTFQAERVDEPAGLYRNVETIDGVETVSGWIVLANDEFRGGTKSGTQFTSAANQPLGWTDPDVNPVRWTDPDTSP